MYNSTLNPSGYPGALPSYQQLVSSLQPMAPSNGTPRPQSAFRAPVVSSASRAPVPAILVPDQVVDLVKDDAEDQGPRAPAKRSREESSEPQVVKRVRPNEVEDDSDDDTVNFSTEEVRHRRLDHLALVGALSRPRTVELADMLKWEQLKSLELDVALETCRPDPLPDALARSTCLKTLKIKSLSGSPSRLYDFYTGLGKNQGISHLDWRADVNGFFLKVLESKKASIAIITLKVPSSRSEHYEDLIVTLRSWPAILNVRLKGSLEDRNQFSRRLSAPRIAANGWI